MQLSFGQPVSCALCIALSLYCCSFQPVHSARVTTLRLGGSLSLTGNLAKQSQDFFRGILLLAETVNRTGCFQGPNSSTLALSLAIKDDHSKAADVIKIYEEASRQGAVDFLLGPYSSLGATAALIASKARMIAILPGQQAKVLPFIFNLNLAARDYMRSGLETLWSVGARTVSFAFDGDEFNEAVCLGATVHAARIGYTVLGQVTLNQGDSTRQIRYLRTLQADVCVVCSGFQQSVLAVIVSRGLGFVPKGMLISSAPSREFIHAVGASNANYIMGPVPWTTDANESGCRVFGSTDGFTKAYRERWSAKPTLHSAEGAAVGIAFLAAVEAAGSLDTDAVKAALIRLDFDSFYGHLAFSPNGERKDPMMFTQQFQPVAIDFVPGRRYVPTQIRLVGPEELPLWPMPSWQQKELEVYPCRPGVVSTVLPNAPREAGDLPFALMDCVPCPVGRYRHEYALACEDCEAGRYGDVEGLDACMVCPDGAVCPAGFRPGQPNASAGYYRLPQQPLKIVSCQPPELCLGSNQCFGRNRGILCWQCAAGSSNEGLLHFGKTCGKCPNAAVNAMGVLILLLYGAHIFFIAKATVVSSRKGSGIHSVILKMYVSYLQLSGAILEATEFHSMADDLFDGDAPFFPGYFKVVSMFHNPLEAMISLDCIFGSSFRAEQANVLLGFLLIPVALTVQIFGALSMQYWRIRTFEQRHGMTVKCRAKLYGMASNSMNPQNLSQVVLGDASGEHHHDSKSPEQQWHSIQEHSTDWASGAIVWCFVLHAISVRLMLTPVNCMELDVLRLKEDLGITCGSEDHRFWRYLSVAGIIIFGLGVPFVMWLILFRVRHKLFQPDIRKKFGFLYNGYELHLFYFEMIYMLRKVVILCFAIVPSRYMRLIGLATISYGFLFVHAQCEPFDNRGLFCLDILERASLRALTVTVMSRLMFDIRTLLVDTFFWPALNNKVIDLLLVIVPIACQAWFMVFATWCLFRNTVLKTWQLQAELWPKGIMKFKLLILRIDAHLHNKVTFDEEENTIDISCLCRIERHYLLTALQDTLERYMESNPMVHPGLVVNAVREAFQSALATRMAKGHQLLLLKVGVSDQSLLKSWFWSIVGEVRMSLKYLLRDMDDSDVGGMHAPRVGHGTKLNEAAHMDAILKRGVSVEELYNHLMMLWPDILEKHERFFDAAVLAARDEVVSKPSFQEDMDMIDLFAPPMPGADAITKEEELHQDEMNRSEAAVDHLDPETMQQLMASATSPLVPDAGKLECWNKDLTNRNVHLKIENEALRKQIVDNELLLQRLSQDMDAAQQVAEHLVEQRAAAKQALREQIIEEEVLQQRLAKDVAVAQEAAQTNADEPAIGSHSQSLISQHVEVIPTVQGMHAEMFKQRPKQKLRKPSLVSTSNVGTQAAGQDHSQSQLNSQSPSALGLGTNGSLFTGVMLQPRDPSAWRPAAG